VVVLAAALALAALLGWLLAEMLVAMLQHVFDPPPTASRSMGFPRRARFRGSRRRFAAAALVALQVRRLPLGAILREE